MRRRGVVASAWTGVRFRRDAVRAARAEGVRVGDRCRLIDVSLKTFGSEPYLVSLGDHVTLTSGVRFLTHDGGVWVLRDRYPDLDVVGEIVVEDNVFIGVNALILPDVRIGRNSVVAAGSVVTRSVPSGSVVAGVPARVVSSVEDYERRSLQVGLHVRSLPPAQKRQRFLDHVRHRSRIQRPYR